MKKLVTLKPRLGTLTASRVKTLDAKAGTTLRIRGRAWTKTRERVALAQDYRCVDCGLVWRPHVDHVDHQVPLEQSGSNDDSNLRLRCVDCHRVKTAMEAAARAFGGGSA